MEARWLIPHLTKPTPMVEPSRGGLFSCAASESREGTTTTTTLTMTPVLHSTGTTTATVRGAASVVRGVAALMMKEERDGSGSGPEIPLLVPSLAVDEEGRSGAKVEVPPCRRPSQPKGNCPSRRFHEKASEAEEEQVEEGATDADAIATAAIAPAMAGVPANAVEDDGTLPSSEEEGAGTRHPLHRMVVVVLAKAAGNGAAGGGAGVLKVEVAKREGVAGDARRRESDCHCHCHRRCSARSWRRAEPERKPGVGQTPVEATPRGGPRSSRGAAARNWTRPVRPPNGVRRRDLRHSLAETEPHRKLVLPVEEEVMGAGRRPPLLRHCHRCPARGRPGAPLRDPCSGEGPPRAWILLVPLSLPVRRPWESMGTPSSSPPGLAPPSSPRQRRLLLLRRLPSRRCPPWSARPPSATKEEPAGSRVPHARLEL